MPLVKLKHATLNFQLNGPKSAPTLVLSNAIGTDLNFWDGQLAAFTEDFRVLRYDARGHGGSSSPAGEYALADLGNDVIELIRSVNAFADGIGGAMLWVIHHRLTRLRRRFAALVAQLAAGEPRRIAKSRPPGSRGRSSFVGPVLRMPSNRGCLCGLAPSCAAAFGGDLEQMLTTDAEMMALVASDPRFGRILRPLFHMIGRPLPACVPALPPRAPRPPRVRKPRAPRPVRPLTGRALLTYLPWKKPRPPMKADGTGMRGPPGTKGVSLSRKSRV